MSAFKGKNVFVAGGSGFLGTNILLYLSQQGCNKIRATHFENEPKTEIPGVEWVKADLRVQENCHKVMEGMDYVFHAAANTAGAAVMVHTPLVHVTPNVVMNAYMLEAAYSAGVEKFLFISSGAAYPDAGAHPAEEDEMLEGEPLGVYHAVAWMKRYTEILCKTYATKIKKPMPCVVIRPSNVYGPWDKFDPNKSHVTAALIRRVVTRENPMDIWGTGEDVRDLIYIDDFIRGIMTAFEKTNDYLEVNIASGKGHSIKELLETAMEVDAYTDATVTYDPSKPSTAPIKLFNVERAKQVLGFETEISLQEGFKRTMDWYRQQDFNY